MQDNDIFFLEDSEGVHVMDISEEERTLCGTWDSEDNQLSRTLKQTVTCKACVRALELYRKVRFKEKEA